MENLDIISLGFFPSAVIWSHTFILFSLSSLSFLSDPNHEQLCKWDQIGFSQEEEEENRVDKDLHLNKFWCLQLVGRVGAVTNMGAEQGAGANLTASINLHL